MGSADTVKIIQEVPQTIFIWEKVPRTKKIENTAPNKGRMHRNYMVECQRQKWNVMTNI